MTNMLRLAGLSALCMASAAQADGFKDYNMFVTGNMTALGSDTEGRLAVGGNANLRAYSVGAVLPDAASTRQNLVVGGTLTRDGGSTKGYTVVGGTGSFVNYGSVTAPSVVTNSASLPVDFAAQSIRLRDLSTTLAALTPGSGSSVGRYDGGAGHNLQLTLTGTGSALNVFSLTASDLARVNTLKINVNSGSQVLINVAGSAAEMTNMGYQLSGIDETRILYNFQDATSLRFNGIGVLGSVLAPLAELGNSSGVINGQVFVGSFNGGPNWGTSIQVNNRLFSGDLLDRTPPVPNNVGGVPEPATWAQLILGFAIAGVALRTRRRRSTAAAI